MPDDGRHRVRSGALNIGQLAIGALRQLGVAVAGRRGQADDRAQQQDVLAVLRGDKPTGGGTPAAALRELAEKAR